MYNSSDADSTTTATLLFLMNHPGRAFTVSQLTDQLPNYPSANSVRTALYRHIASGKINKSKGSDREQLYWYGDRNLSA